MKKLIFILFVILCSCSGDERKTNEQPNEEERSFKASNTSIIILGTIQDAGSPQIGCFKKCCKDLFSRPDKNRKVVSLGIIDPQNQKKFIIEATPDFVSQTKILKDFCDFETDETPDGIFLTHAHIGHYTGLMYLGKEAMNAKGIVVYAMPKMKSFLEKNGPWSQLVKNENISIKKIKAQQEIRITNQVKIISFTVPHRDEYSETVGYKIIGLNNSALFIPDIDKWNKWNIDISEAISKVDYAFLDATFFDGQEINNRDISEIPHPFIIESMDKFNDLPLSEKKKIYFIHFNHTNPLLNTDSEQAKRVINLGYNIAQINQVFDL